MNHSLQREQRSPSACPGEIRADCLEVGLDLSLSILEFLCYDDLLYIRLFLDSILESLDRLLVDSSFEAIVTSLTGHLLQAEILAGIVDRLLTDFITSMLASNSVSILES
jgi:hypothetical protein